MNFLLFLWRLFLALPLTIGVYVLAIVAIIPDPINVPLLIICYAVGYLLSLSTVIRVAHRKNMYRSGGHKALMYVLACLINLPIAPVTLFISIFGRSYRLFNYNKYEAEYDEESPAVRKLLAKQEMRENSKAERAAHRREAKELASTVRADAKSTRRQIKNMQGVEREMVENGFYERRSALLGTKRSKRELRRAETTGAVSDRIRSSMWRMSADRAVRKILDDSYKGDIRIDDGVSPKIYKQVALINLSMQKYALLAEYGEDGAPSTEADIFAIVPDGSYNTLTLVEDKELAEKIFSVYRTLLAEKVIYNA